MTEAKDVVKGLLKELERYLGPAMAHIPSVANANQWLEQEDGKGKTREVLTTAQDGNSGLLQEG